jgi:hypothetical protein
MALTLRRRHTFGSDVDFAQHYQHLIVGNDCDSVMRAAVIGACGKSRPVVFDTAGRGARIIPEVARDWKMPGLLVVSQFEI